MKTRIALLLAAAGFAGAAEPTTWLDGEYALGDFGGLRPRLAERGVTITSYYVTNPAGNPVGGRKSGGFTYTDNWYLGVTVSLEKAFGWRGATLQISGVQRDGHSLTNRYVGSIYNSQQVYGGQSTFLYNVTLEQELLDRRFSIKVGRFGACDDFNSSPLYGLYMNNGIDGDIRNVLFNTQFSAYPFATWAARVKYLPTPDTFVKVGVFQNTKEVFDRNRHGLDWSFHSGDGAFLIGEIGWTPVFGRRTRASADGKTTVEDRGLPGHYWIGGSVSLYGGYSQFGKTEQTRNSYGFYAHADQMVWRARPDRDEGLTLLAAAGYYPQENISIVPFQLNLGAIYQGLIPGRPNDKTILGLIYGRFSKDYARVEQAAGRGRPTREVVLEAAYRIQCTKFLYVQPDLQWVNRPRGTGRIADALVVGAQIGINF